MKIILCVITITLIAGDAHARERWTSRANPFSTDYIPPAYRKPGAPKWHPKPGEPGSVGVFTPRQPTIIIPSGPIILTPR